MITLRLVCDDEDEDNGCMRVVMGTHLNPLHTVRPQGLSVKRDSERAGAADENVLGTHIDLDIRDDSAVPIPMAAGDVSIHSSRLVHGSGPNLSDRWRRGLTISYMPASMRVVRSGEDAEQPITLSAEDAASRGNSGGASLFPYLYLLRGQGTPGVNDGSARNFRWNPRPVFRPGVHMPFREMAAYSSGGGGSGGDGAAKL
jgi:hypothetical protein